MAPLNQMTEYGKIQLVARFQWDVSRIGEKHHRPSSELERLKKDRHGGKISEVSPTVLNIKHLDICFFSTP